MTGRTLCKALPVRLSYRIGCNFGSYGLSCKNVCGHCLDEQTCDHTNGTCLNGCDPGYFGDLCITGK